MTYDPNDPVRNPDPNPELRTMPVRRKGPSWIGWVVAAAVILVAAFAITEWFDRPGTDPNPTASTQTEPVKPPVAPAAPATPSSEPAAPAPANPSTGGATQQ